MIAAVKQRAENERQQKQSSSAEPGRTKPAGVPSILKDFARCCEGRRRSWVCGVCWGFGHPNGD